MVMITFAMAEMTAEMPRPMDEKIEPMIDDLVWFGWLFKFVLCVCAISSLSVVSFYTVLAPTAVIVIRDVAPTMSHFQCDVGFPSLLMGP